MEKRNDASLKKTGLKPICFVAGKSGGHIIPCLTIAHHEYPGRPILFFTTDGLLDQTVIHQDSVRWHIQLPFGKTSAITCSSIISFAHSLLKSFYWLIKNRPLKIVSTGGLVSVPLCIAGYLLRIPIELFELNATPGRATIALSPLAEKVYYCFDGIQHQLQKTVFRSYPLRFTEKKQLSRYRAISKLGLSRSKKTVLVLGGSQGSTFINNLICSWVSSRSEKTTIQLIHQVKLDQQQEMQSFYSHQKIQAHLFSFEWHMAPFYKAADLVICRAGAGTLFEVKQFNKPCITIPLQTKSTDHQKENAYALRREYRKLVILDQEGCTVKKLDGMIMRLLG